MTAAEINAKRDELYRREAAGQAVASAEWTALGDAQDALYAHRWTPEGYWR